VIKVTEQLAQSYEPWPTTKSTIDQEKARTQVGCSRQQ